MTIVAIEDRRQSERRRVLKSGSIRFGNTAIFCMLRSLSPAGVSLDVASSIGIPDQFTLLIEAELKIHSCAVIWRKERRMGVAFH
jgi:hypothetical protein